MAPTFEDSRRVSNPVGVGVGWWDTSITPCETVSDSSYTGAAPLPPSGTDLHRTIGIDVGNAGALALLDASGNLLHLADMPVTPDGPKSRPSVNPALLAALLRRWQPSRAFVEFVSHQPSDGPAGAFAFGKARGHVEGALAALGIPLKYLTVPTWKRAIGIPAGKGMKSVARSEACRRWPGHAEHFARVKDDGRAEAALIAIAGMTKEEPR